MTSQERDALLRAIAELSANQVTLAGALARLGVCGQVADAEESRRVAIAASKAAKRAWLVRFRLTIELDPFGPDFEQAIQQVRCCPSHALLGVLDRADQRVSKESITEYRKGYLCALIAETRAEVVAVLSRHLDD